MPKYSAMELQNEVLELSNSRKRSHVKAPYSDEVEGIQRSLGGDLEVVRQKLKLSKKEMAKLLLVDPSAWTRWTTGVSRTPAHVYRSLQWYLELQEFKNKEKLSLNKSSTSYIGKIQKTAPKKIAPAASMKESPSPLPSSNWAEERKELLSQIESREKIGFIWKLLVLVALSVALFR